MLLYILIKDRKSFPARNEHLLIHSVFIVRGIFFNSWIFLDTLWIALSSWTRGQNCDMEEEDKAPLE